MCFDDSSRLLSLLAGFRDRPLDRGHAKGKILYHTQHIVYGGLARPKLVVDGVAVVFEQRALANRAASTAALSRRNVAALRAMYVGKA